VIINKTVDVTKSFADIVKAHLIRMKVIMNVTTQIVEATICQDMKTVHVNKHVAYIAHFNKQVLQREIEQKNYKQQR